MRIELTELGACSAEPEALQRAAALDLDRLKIALEPLVALEAGWPPGTMKLRAGLAVGTIRVGDLRLDVRPRQAAAELAVMIRYALGGPVAAWKQSEIAVGRIGIDELVCGVFADALAAIRQAGLARNYVSPREALPVLRGRPDFVASFPWNDRGNTSIVCRYHKLTCDNLDNQIVRAALERAAMMQTSVATRRRLLEHRAAWSELASWRTIRREDFVTVRQRYTRLSEHYRHVHNLAELILAGQRPAALFEAGPVATGGICLDMADLFERFVERLLRDVLRREGLDVRSQESDRRALVDREGRPYRRVRPDVTVYATDRPVCIIDAKYKDYWAARDDGTPRRRVSNEDLYQLFFYAQRAKLRHGLSRVPPAYIVSPLPAADERSADVIAERYRLIRWQAGEESCEVRLVLLPLTEVLRRMARGEATAGRELAELVPRVA